MPATDTKGHKRVNVTLAPETIAILERVAKKGSRSGLIDQAVRHYVNHVGFRTLRTVDRQRLVKRLGSLRPHTLVEVNAALEISLGLFEV